MCAKWLSIGHTIVDRRLVNAPLIGPLPLLVVVESRSDQGLIQTNTSVPRATRNEQNQTQDSQDKQCFFKLKVGNVWTLSVLFNINYVRCKSKQMSYFPP